MYSKETIWIKYEKLITWNEEMNDILKIFKSLEESDLLVKSVSETIENEAKEQKGGFISMLLGTIGASLLGNLLTGKRVKWSKIIGRGLIQAGEGTVRASQDF